VEFFRGVRSGGKSLWKVRTGRKTSWSEKKSRGGGRGGRGNRFLGGGPIYLVFGRAFFPLPQRGGGAHWGKRLEKKTFTRVLLTGKNGGCRGARGGGPGRQKGLFGVFWQGIGFLKTCREKFKGPWGKGVGGREIRFGFGKTQRPPFGRGGKLFLGAGPFRKGETPQGCRGGARWVPFGTAGGPPLLKEGR